MTDDCQKLVICPLSAKDRVALESPEEANRSVGQ